MKKITFLLLTIIIISCSINNKESKISKYSLSGEIKNLKDSTFIILKTFNSNPRAIDSTYLQNNRFILNFNNSKKGLYLLKLKDSKDSMLLYFDFLFENKDLQIKGDFNKKETVKINNSPINDFLRNYRNIPLKYNSQLENIFKTIKDQEKIQFYFEKFKDSIENDQINILFTKPNNLFSINEILRLKHKISKNKMFDFYTKLNKELKISPNGKLIKEYLSSNQITTGKKFIDFKAKDLSGKNVNLSNFKGKIILLDFWAYWCTWCHVQNKEEFSGLNKKYKNDLVIISYSLDEEEDMWEKSVKKDSYKWVNLSNLKGMKDPIAYKYKVNNLPHSFLIDKEGIIIREFIGYSKDSLIETEIKKLILN
jgi:peroxiredoxin